MFTYLIGREVTFAPNVKWIACNNKGAVWEWCPTSLHPSRAHPPLLGPTSPCLEDNLRKNQTLLAHVKCACVQRTQVLRAEPPHFPVTLPRDTMTKIHAGCSPPRSPVLIVSQLLAFDNLSKALLESLTSFGIKQTFLL